MQCQDNTSYNAGFGIRFAAYMVDLLLVGIVTGIFKITAWSISLVNPDNILNRQLLFDKTGTAIVAYLISVVYFICTTYTSGRTIGKMIFKLKVVSVDEDGMNLWDICYRETVGRYLSTVVFYLGYLIVLGSKDKQALHDILADTRVVYDFNDSDISTDFKGVEKKTTVNRTRRRRRSVDSYMQAREESLGHATDSVVSEPVQENVTEPVQDSIPEEPAIPAADEVPEVNTDVIYGQDTETPAETFNNDEPW